MANTHNKALKAALEWYVDQGIDEAIDNIAIDRRKNSNVKKSNVNISSGKNKEKEKFSAHMISSSHKASLGKSDAWKEAVKLASKAETLEELRIVISEFEGLSLKKTATNLVFCDGNSKSSVMLIGDAPGADEDRLGKPFVGVSGKLLDSILKYINLDRNEQNPKKALYLSNILNWRPPGNRTPSLSEIEVSLPFIEKHIALVKPKILILCGGISAKALLGRSEGILRLRKSCYDYKPQTKELGLDVSAISAIVTYNPVYLLSTPSQKKAVWADMLSIEQKLNDFFSSDNIEGTTCV